MGLGVVLSPSYIYVCFSCVFPQGMFSTSCLVCQPPVEDRRRLLCKYMNILFINIMLLVLLNIRICPFNLHYNQIFRSKLINSHFLLLIYHRNKHRSMLFNWFVNCIVYFYNCLNVLSPYFIYVCFSCVFPQGIVGSSYFHLSYYCYLRATPLKTSLFVQLLWNTQ